jgi:hypothetical protein
MTRYPSSDQKEVKTKTFEMRGWNSISTIGKISRRLIN